MIMRKHQRTHVERVVPKYEKPVLFQTVRDVSNRERLMRLKKSDEIWKLNAVEYTISWMVAGPEQIERYY